MSDRIRARRANGEGSISEPRPGDGAIVLRVTAPDGRRRKRIAHREQETPSQHRRRAERILREFVAEVAAKAAPVDPRNDRRRACDPARVPPFGGVADDRRRHGPRRRGVRSLVTAPRR